MKKQLVAVLVFIPALMLAFAGYAEDPKASPKGNPEAMCHRRGRNNRNVEGNSR
jgi:hypothetical protein